MPILTPLSPLDLNVQIPHYFRCPISLELMRDPVILSTGQTYDRSSIEKWVASGNITCPVTRQKLDDFTLIPNHTLRRLIQEWCVANRSRGVERIPTPKQPAEPQRVKSLLAEAGVDNGPATAFAIRTITNLAKECDKNRNLMVDLQVVPVLITALFIDVDSRNSSLANSDFGSEEAFEALRSENESSVVDIMEEALGALVLFPLSDTDRLSIMQPRRLALISNILLWGGMEARVNAGALVEMLSDSKELSELRVVLASTEGIIEGLVNLLQREPLYPKAVKVGIKALFSLCLRKPGKERAVAAGATPVLIERLVDVDKIDAERALGTIELLCTTDSGCAAVAKHSLAAAVLVTVILKVSDRATEYAAGSLLAICSFSPKVQKEALQAGIIKELLLLMQSDCTNRAKTKAMNLLKLLRGAWLIDSCMPEYGRADVVPF